MAEFPITLYEDSNFDGGHEHIIVREKTSLPRFNDKTSSIYIAEGVWEFYRNNGFNDPYTKPNGEVVRLGPGEYPSVEEVHINNDTLSSLRRVQ